GGGAPVDLRGVLGRGRGQPGAHGRGAPGGGRGSRPRDAVVSGLVVTDVLLDGARASVRCDTGRIVAGGDSVPVEPGDERVDGAGLVLLPGFVNGHTHAAMTLLRGSGDDLALGEWLRTAVWPREARLEPEDVYWGTRLACIEMLRSGTVAF